MLFSELYKVMVKEDTFTSFMGDNSSNRPPWIPSAQVYTSLFSRDFKIWISSLATYGYFCFFYVKTYNEDT